MKEKTIRRNLYRVLRKTGVQKKDISVTATYDKDLKFDTVDWKIFTYYLEGVFNISINDEELVKLDNICNTIHFLGNPALFFAEN